MGNSAIAWVATLLAALAIVSCSPSDPKELDVADSPSSPLGGSAQPASAVGSQVGNRAPDFRLTRVDGGTVRLDGLVEQGKPFVLYFFATW